MPTPSAEVRLPEERLLDLPAVLRRVPVARSTLYEWRKLGLFPLGRKVGPRRRLWTEREVNDFVAGIAPTPHSD